VQSVASHRPLSLCRFLHASTTPIQNSSGKSTGSRETAHAAPVIETFYDEFQQKHNVRPYHLRKVLRVKAEGKGILLNPLFNKGTAHNSGERDRLGLRGLLPSQVMTFEGQIERVMQAFYKEKDPFRKYQQMRDLHDRNETLFHRVCLDYIKDVAPIIYTPTVGQACIEFGHDYRRARGMYFSSNDHGQMASMCYNWPGSDVQVIVVTDGSRILGLGDLGANGMGIPVGKLALYCAAGGIAPHRVLPVMFDMGTDNQELWADKLYLGLKHKRLDGDEYYEMLDEFMFAVRSRWRNVFVQFEDFSSDKAMKILNRYRKHHLCFNDDIQGTGAVAVAGLLCALRQQGKKPSDLVNQRIVVAGAGSAGLGVANALTDAMVLEGMSEEDARANFWIVDADGVLNHDRALTTDQVPFARTDHTSGMALHDVIQEVKPSILLGLTACGGLFTHEIIKDMAAHNDRPIIFPLSNPTESAECTAEDVYTLTEGRGVFASGSPFDAFEFNGKNVVPSQCNNMFIFPGIGLAATVGKCRIITDAMIYKASIALSDSLTQAEENEGRIFPDVSRIRDVSFKVACAVLEQAYNENLVLNDSLLERIEKVGNAEDAIADYVRIKMYDPIYVPLVDQVYNRDLT